MGVFDVRSEFAKLIRGAREPRAPRFNSLILNLATVVLAHVYSTPWLGMALTAFS